MQTSEDAGRLGGIYRWTAHFPAVNTKDWWYWVHRRSSQLGKGLPSRGLAGAYLPLPWILWPGAPPPESAAPAPASLTRESPRAGAEAAHPWPLFKIRKCHFSSGYVSFVFSLSKQFRVIIFAFNLKPLSGVCVCFKYNWLRMYQYDKWITVLTHLFSEHRMLRFPWWNQGLCHSVLCWEKTKKEKKKKHKIST